MTTHSTAAGGQTAGVYAPAMAQIEYRVSDIHGHGTLALEKSKQPIGATWRNWLAVDAALPAEIARIRCDFGNGLIGENEKNSREAQWHKSLAKQRRATRAALAKTGGAA